MEKRLKQASTKHHHDAIFCKDILQSILKHVSQIGKLGIPI